VGAEADRMNVAGNGRAFRAGATRIAAGEGALARVAS
jgi:hypothetical protein